MSAINSKASLLLLIIGLFLFSINFIGFFMSLRNPHLYEEETMFLQDITLTPADIERMIVRGRNESNFSYAVRMNSLVNNGMALYWSDDGYIKYNLRIPIWENYLLYLLHFIKPDGFKKYEFCNYYKALERGVGLCSQQAIALAGILNDNNVESQIVKLEGHIVVRANITADTWYIFDPDYGVYIPLDLHDIENDVSVIVPYYENIRNTLRTQDGKDYIELLKKVYKPGDNYIYEEGVKEYHPRRYYLEYFLYYAKWIIPILLTLPYVCLSWRARGDRFRAMQGRADL